MFINRQCIDWESYGVATRFCYLGDILDGGGGAEAAVTARVRRGWQKFRELAPFLASRAPSLRLKGRVYEACVRSSMIYGSETWALKTEGAQKLERAEMRMVRWMSGASLRDRLANSELRRRLGLESISEVVRRRRLRWFGHVVRKEEGDWTRKAWKWKVDGPIPRGRPRKTWDDVVVADCRQLGLTTEDAMDRTRWKVAMRRPRPTQEDLDNGR